MHDNSIPVVMCCSGHDPSGGAGMAADMEALISQACRPVTVVTALTVQNSQGLQDFLPVTAAWVAEQMRCLMADHPVAAVKIGMLGSPEVAEAVHSVLRDLPGIPVVFDPVLATGMGQTLALGDLVHVIRSLLLPQVRVLTPNHREAQAICSEADNAGACAQALLGMGCEYVLITGADTDQADPHVTNVLYSSLRELQVYRWPRLPDSYHGSGCTLAAAIAGLLAHGAAPEQAVQQAQKYTWECLQHAFNLGKGQRLPNRFYWTQQRP